jgi:signal transduction histidine kinase
MWIGLSQQGIARYKDGHFTLFGTNDGLPPGRVNDLFLDRQGRLWIATSRGGLSHVEETNAPLPAFINYRMAEGLSSNQLTAIAEDSYGRIYAATGRGVDQLTPETGRVKHYTTADGLAPGQILDVFGDRNGSLWFATNQGLSRFVPQPERHSPAPPIFIKALRLGGEKQAISPLGETDINLHDIVPARNQLQIDFVGISFLPGEKIAYQYKLEGTKDDWSMQAEQATINFASLAPGHYRLLMRAIDADGLISPAPASITFTVLRPFWQRWWFVLFATVTLVLMSYWIYRYRLSRLLELERVRTRIASDLHDDIGSGLSRLAILSEVSRHEASGAKVSERLGEIADGARQLVDSMSDIVWIVNPKLDQLRDLVQRMRRFASDLFTASGIEFTFQGPDEQHMKVEPDVRRHLFLIFKESVNNAARHSACTKADIRLLLEDGCFILTIADNGRGFDPANAAEVNGLINMRERARTLNGDFIIDSRSGAGTTISLKAPLKGTVKERNGRLRGSKP